MTPKKKPEAPLVSYRHEQAKRANLPTDQTASFMRDDQLEPVPYTPEVRAKEGPRLSWRRAASLDDLQRKAGPLYVHEKVSPAAFAQQLAGKPALSLFDDFNGLPPDAQWQCYTHQGNWQNRIIKGHSDDVMASLAGKENLAGQVQMIYWDPPYGIGFDTGNQLTTKKREGGPPTEASPVRVFRDTYRDGIHSYLNAVYRTAVIGRSLLAESGSFFLQISTKNLHRCALVLDEVFGPENRVATIAFAKTGSSSSITISEVCDYLLWFARDKDRLKSHQLYERLKGAKKIQPMDRGALVELPDGTRRKPTDDERADPDHLAEGARLCSSMPLFNKRGANEQYRQPVCWEGRKFYPPLGKDWRVDADGMRRLVELKRLEPAGDTLRWIRYEHENPGRKINNLWSSTMAPQDLHYVVETAESAIERCILMATDPGDLVLDPTCGSGTTAFVAEKWGRRWITIDASAIPVALCRHRMVMGIHDWFLTRDDFEGWRKEVELGGSDNDAPPPPDGQNLSLDTTQAPALSTSVFHGCRRRFSLTIAHFPSRCSSIFPRGSVAGSGSQLRLRWNPTRRGGTKQSHLRVAA